MNRNRLVHDYHQRDFNFKLEELQRRHKHDMTSLLMRQQEDIANFFQSNNLHQTFPMSNNRAPQYNNDRNFYDNFSRPHYRSRSILLYPPYPPYPPPPPSFYNSRYPAYKSQTSYIGGNSGPYGLTSSNRYYDDHYLINYRQEPSNIRKRRVTFEDERYNRMPEPVKITKINIEDVPKLLGEIRNNFKEIGDLKAQFSRGNNEKIQAELQKKLLDALQVTKQHAQTVAENLPDLHRQLSESKDVTRVRPSMTRNEADAKSNIDAINTLEQKLLAIHLEYNSGNKQLKYEYNKESLVECQRILYQTAHINEQILTQFIGWKREISNNQSLGR